MNRIISWRKKWPVNNLGGQFYEQLCWGYYCTIYFDPLYVTFNLYRLLKILYMSWFMSVNDQHWLRLQTIYNLGNWTIYIFFCFHARVFLNFATKSAALFLESFQINNCMIWYSSVKFPVNSTPVLLEFKYQTRTEL